MAVLIFWGFAIVYALRVNLSVAIVSMVTPDTKNSTKGECAQNSSYTEPFGVSLISEAPIMDVSGDTYNWTSQQQGLVLGSFFYGSEFDHFSVFDKISICSTKFRFFDKISIFRQNFDFSTKFRFLDKISIYR